MTLWEWVRHHILARRPPPPEVVEAREVARRLGKLADELNEHLQKYSRARDPFASFMADLYNRDQLSRLYRGPEA